MWDGFTREEAQKVQKTSSLKIQAVYLECESEEANPLLEDAVLEVNRAVEEHFAKMQEETGYVEAYHNLHVYTKEGKDETDYCLHSARTLECRQTGPVRQAGV